MWWFLYFSVWILTFAACSSVILPVLKQACPSERILLHLCMNRAIHISQNTSFCHAVDMMCDSRVRATADRLCAARAPHVRCTYDTHPRQWARASSVGKTPPFSFCQVDMYAKGIIFVIKSFSSLYCLHELRQNHAAIASISTISHSDELSHAYITECVCLPLIRGYIIKIKLCKRQVD